MERQGQMKKRERSAKRARHMGSFLGILFGVVCLFSACKREEAVFTAGEAPMQIEASKQMEEEQEDSLGDAQGPPETGKEEPEETEPSVEGGASADTEEPAKAEEPDRIVVYICGQVKEPGVYELEAGARIGDAVEKASGMTEDAAEDALNLAQTLADGQMIRVPSKEEFKETEKDLVIVSGGSGGDQAAAPKGGTADSRPGSADGTGAGGLISLNQATKEELMTLPGIGESKAEAILNYRRKQGGFGSIEEIMNISGIKEGVYLKIKDKISI